MNHAEHGGNDAERRQAVAHGVERAGDGGFLVMMGFQVLVHQVLELVLVLAAHGQQAQIVAQEIHRVVVGQNQRKLCEQSALFRILDVRFERQIALGFGQLEQLMQEAEQLAVTILLVLRPLEHAPETFAEAAEDRLGVADDEGAEGAAQDDHEFERLPQHAQMAARNGVTTNDRNYDNDGADND